MRLLVPMTVLLLAVALDACRIVAAQPAAPEPVEILRPNGVLHAWLVKPSGDGPFPAVIALHGCGGLGAPLNEPYAEWAARLVQSGHAVLLPDSYGSREVGPQCQVAVKERRVMARRERVADVQAARHWLAQQQFVKRGRISLIGWDNGGSAVLWAVRPQLAGRDGDGDFRAAVALYPDCRLSARLGWSARVPTLLLIGGNDTVSPPQACRSMVDGAQGRSALARIVVYPGADHDFDRTAAPAVTGAAVSGAIRVGEPRLPLADPDARRDAAARVSEWLGR